MGDEDTRRPLRGTGPPRISGCAQAPPTHQSRPALAHRRLALALAIAFAALPMFMPSSALARETHVFSANFGSFSSPRGVAVNESTAHVYVVSGTHVYNFDPSGTPLMPELTLDSSTPELTGVVLTQPEGLVVDNSHQATAGDIYVADLGSEKVDRFNPQGEFIGTFANKSSIPAEKRGPRFQPTGIAVDASGDVYIGDYQNEVVDEFSSSGSFIAQFGYGHLHSIVAGVAVAPSGDLYVATYYNAVIEFAPSGECVNECAPIDPEALSDAYGVAVDSSTGDLYAAAPSGISRFGSSGTLIEQFSHLSSFPWGVAVNGSNGIVYATDSSARTASIFSALIVPDVLNEPPTELEHTSVTLHGRVDPAGGGEVTSCQFEYGPTLPYGQTAPCSPSTPYSGSTDVSAHITGLAVGDEYHYRLAATNASGTNASLDQTFIAPAVKEVSTEAATQISGTSATLTGTYLGEGLDTHFYFEYGTSPAYGQTSTAPPGTDKGSGTGTQTVSEGLEGLEEGTIYYYRLVATNSFGTTHGEQQTFTTHQRPTIDQFTSRNVTGTTAELVAKINPNGEDTTYHFEYGPTTSYGTRTPAPRESDIGSGTSDQLVIAQLSNLQSGLTYHFRLVAESELGTTTSADQTFGFFTPNCPNASLRQETGATTLPDCRAYELVSPADMGAAILTPIPHPAGPNSLNSPLAINQFAYSGIYSAIPNSGKPEDGQIPDLYVATRNPEGWVTKFVGVPSDETNNGSEVAAANLAGTEYLVYSESKAPFPNAPPQGPLLYRSDGTLVGPLPAVQEGQSSAGYQTERTSVAFSPDFSHFLFHDFLSGDVYDNDVAQRSLTNISQFGNPIAFPSTSGYAPGTGISSDGSHIVMENHSGELFMLVDDALTYDLGVGRFVGMTSDGSTVIISRDGALVTWSEATDAESPVSTGASESALAVAGESGAVLFYSPEQLDGPRGIAGQQNLYEFRNGATQYVGTDLAIKELNFSPNGDHVGFFSSAKITNYDNTSPTGVCSYREQKPATGPDCQEVYTWEPGAATITCDSCDPERGPPRQ